MKDKINSSLYNEEKEVKIHSGRFALQVPDASVCLSMHSCKAKRISTKSCAHEIKNCAYEIKSRAHNF